MWQSEIARKREREEKRQGQMIGRKEKATSNDARKSNWKRCKERKSN
jgi:hypothetical protein